MDAQSVEPARTSHTVKRKKKSYAAAYDFFDEGECWFPSLVEQFSKAE
jgi:hypothetical protein